jgi:xanthine dehydrogenase molybdopterin-binding subunit B
MVGTACLSLQSAVRAGSERHVVGCDYEIGAAAPTAAVLDAAERIVRGTVLIGSQNHFYMEPLSAYAVPEEEGGMIVYTGMQWPGATHSAVAGALGVRESRVRVVHRRAGGGFGGKATNASWVACLAAVGAYRCRRPVRLTLTREDDLKLVGGRDELLYEYAASYGSDGKISALRVNSALNAGWTVDQSPATQVGSIDSFSQVYHLPTCHLKSSIYLTYVAGKREPCLSVCLAAVYFSAVAHHRCMFTCVWCPCSNVANRSPMRGPGELSSSFAIENILCEIAHHTGLLPHEVRERNMYPALSAEDTPPKLPNGHPLTHYSLPAMWQRLKTEFDFEAKRADIVHYNKENRWRKRGIAMTPVRFEVNVWSKVGV